MSVRTFHSKISNAHFDRNHGTTERELSKRPSVGGGLKRVLEKTKA